MTSGVPIPHFYLYGRLDGDDHAEVEVDFLHIEPIRKRSGSYNWTIEPHAHPHHYQLLYVVVGGGSIDIEDHRIAVEPPCLISVPVGTIHRIRFHPDTDGSVITAAESFVAQSSLGDPRLLESTRQSGVFPLASTGLAPEQITRRFEELSREFVYSAPGRRAAIMAHFVTVLVALMRAQVGIAGRGAPTGSRSYALALRYRDLVERHFREERRLEFYAARLGVTPARLNAACKARLGTTASALLHGRIITEAKRWLIYTGMTVAEIGYALGFEDPAYFSRFFSKRAGVAPGRLREELGAHPPVVPSVPSPARSE
jgi:AraC family transcriptional activator of pobA